MNGYRKEHAGHDTGKSHSTKCERELLYRICPSKLSKKELEDLYFALLENNLELKKTLNSQQDNIKLLSTKVQRMTATQRSSLIKESKDCCAATKAVVQEQKACIADLKKSNERMSERIRILNMRLCTAKQFLKQSPSQTMSRCFKCLTAAPASMKNSSVSVLHSRRSENNPKTSVATSQYILMKKIFCFYFREVTTKDVETETCELETGSSDKMCNENKCKTLMEEFKQKIINLQEELSHTHEEYSSRISSLEREVNRAEQQRSLQEEQNGTRVRELAAKLRDQEANYNDISTQLSIEKSKVTELEMRLKAADSSAQIAKTIDTHLSNINELRRQSSKPDNKFKTSSPLQLPNWEVPSLHLEVPVLQPVINRVSPGPEPEPDREDTRLSKHSDDSGYTDVNRTQDYDQDNKALAKINKELMERISSLQEQLDAIKISTVSNEETIKQLLHNKSFQSEDIDTEDYKDVGVDDVSDGPSQEFTKKIIVEKQRNKSNTEQSPDRNESLQERRSKERSADMCRVNELWNSYDDTPNTENTIQATSTHPIQLEQLEQSVGKKKEPVPSARQKPIKNATNTKSDTHNSFQIPGPLPVHNTENIAGSKEKPWPRAKRKLIDIRTRKDTNNSKDNLNANNAGKYEEPTLQTEDETTQFYQNRNATVDKQPALDGSEQNLKLGSTKIESLDHAKISDDKQDATVNKMQANNAGVQEAVVDVNQLGTQMDNGQHTHHKQRPQADRQRRPSHRPLSGDRTYSIAGDNTDCEISSLTDLPDEGDADVASYREPLSPGEHKATTTECTDHTTTTTDYGSLSEGELPAPVRKRSKELRATAETKLIQPVSVTQKVEEALQAIGEELARCRELLHTQKPLGVNFWSSF
ncbi:DNA ligase 1-like [Achroia grisella]|uniref:DNA ligase 1-like n=1 Tax=Achroia grisella TaxID=688607 RepID=UPI0027D22162|nr:DNA ligase 1-like [Achroia grisella]